MEQEILGCQESRYHLGECVWGADGGKEGFGEWIDGVENCCSKELQSSLAST